MKNIITIVLLVLVQIGYSQEEIASFFYPDLIQSGQLNPAFTTNDRFSLGIGSTYLHLDVRGPKIRDLYRAKKYFAAVRQSLTRNYLSTDASIHAFDVGFTIKDWDIRTGYNSNFRAFFNFSPDIGKLIKDGNGDLIGKTFDIGPELFMRNISEFYVGFSKPVYDQYRIGANLKILNGAFDISTAKSEFNITTKEEYYQLELETDYLINTSYNNLEFSVKELIPFAQALQDNIGVSADIGFQYIGEKYKISTSILDIGWITWSSNPSNYRTQGKYEFNGLTFDDFQKDSLSLNLDKLKGLFDVRLTNNNYTTFTPIKFNIMGEYEHNRWVFGAIAYVEMKQLRVLPAFGISAKTKIWDAWELGAQYSIKNRTYTNFGLSSVLNLGPIQMYALTDNIIGPFLGLNKRTINFRVGINISVNRKEEPKPPKVASLY